MPACSAPSILLCLFGTNRTRAVAVKAAAGIFCSNRFGIHSSASRGALYNRNRLLAASQKYHWGSTRPPAHCQSSASSVLSNSSLRKKFAHEGSFTALLLFFCGLSYFSTGSPLLPITGQSLTHFSGCMCTSRPATPTSWKWTKNPSPSGVSIHAPWWGPLMAVLPCASVTFSS